MNVTFGRDLRLQQPKGGINIFSWHLTLWNGESLTVTGTTLLQAIESHNWNSSNYISRDKILSAERI